MGERCLRADGAVGGLRAGSARSIYMDCPTAFITCSDIDPLRDEALDYALRLLRAGVAAELHVCRRHLPRVRLLAVARLSTRRGSLSGAAAWRRWVTEPARSGCGGWRCFSDAGVAQLPIFAKTHDSLVAAGLDVITYTDARVEPTDASFLDGVRFAQELNPDGYVSLGGGSVIDTCKAANLYASCPADFLTYVNAPIGEGKPVPGPLKPHIACPTTAGTGSEVTGITIFDLLSLKAKTGHRFSRAASHRSAVSTPTAPRACRPRSSPRRASMCCRTLWSPTPRGPTSGGALPNGPACGP